MFPSSTLPERTARQPAGRTAAAETSPWVFSVLIWMSGVLTGVSYCCAVTAAQAAEEAPPAGLMVSVILFGVGCAVAVSVTVRGLRASVRTKKTSGSTVREWILKK